MSFESRVGQFVSSGANTGQVTGSSGSNLGGALAGSLPTVRQPTAAEVAAANAGTVQHFNSWVPGWYSLTQRPGDEAVGGLFRRALKPEETVTVLKNTGQLTGLNPRYDNALVARAMSGEQFALGGFSIPVPLNEYSADATNPLRDIYLPYIGAITAAGVGTYLGNAAAAAGGASGTAGQVAEGVGGALTTAAPAANEIIVTAGQLGSNLGSAAGAAGGLAGVGAAAQPPAASSSPNEMVVTAQQGGGAAGNAGGVGGQLVGAGQQGGPIGQPYEGGTAGQAPGAGGTVNGVEIQGPGEITVPEPQLPPIESQSPLQALEEWIKNHIPNPFRSSPGGNKGNPPSGGTETGGTPGETRADGKVYNPNTDTWEDPPANDVTIPFPLGGNDGGNASSGGSQNLNPGGAGIVSVGPSGPRLAGLPYNPAQYKIGQAIASLGVGPAGRLSRIGSFLTDEQLSQGVR